MLIPINNFYIFYPESTIEKRKKIEESEIEKRIKESEIEKRIEESEFEKINEESTVEERNVERIKILKNFCESSDLYKKKITNFTLNHIHIDHQSKTLYCFVPKVNIL